MIDTHTHLNFVAFKDNWSDVVARAINSGVSRMIVVGTDLKSSKKAVAMAREHPALFAAVGIHPHHARSYLDKNSVEESNSYNQVQLFEDVIQINKLAREEKVVAIGEVGLDHHQYRMSKYSIDNSEAEWAILHHIQEELFSQQIKLAHTLGKPLIVHSREVGELVLDMLEKSQHDIKSTSSGSIHQPKRIQAVFHCFDGSKKYLKRIIEAGYLISFTGNITFIPDRLAVSKLVPLDRLMLETDSPYMSPMPNRSHPNEPANINQIAMKHAQARGISLSEIIKETDHNAKLFFGLPPSD